MSDELIQSIFKFLGGLLVSSGIWGYLIARMNHRYAKKAKLGERYENMAAMLLGLGHDKIVSHGNDILERGYITHDEYENLYDYLYLPYKALGGNGSAERTMEQIKKLPSIPDEERGRIDEIHK